MLDLDIGWEGAQLKGIVYLQRYKSTDPVHPGVYPSHAQAEQMISVTGIKNAQAAYFRGKTNLIGAP